jgi:hypothetical protein
MKVAITGHTQGLGKKLYEYFINRGDEVIGISRTTGYDISKDIDKIVEISSDCDLFINNTYKENYQLEILKKIQNKVKNIIVCGSTSRMYTEIITSEYAKHKQELAEACRLISIKPKGPNILHLDMSFIFNPEFDSQSDYDDTYYHTTDDVVKCVEFWLENPKVREMEFTWKLTPSIYKKIKNSYGTESLIIKLIEEIKHI